MTENEFKLCVSLLFKNHRGKTLQEVLNSNIEFTHGKFEDIVMKRVGFNIKVLNDENVSFIFYSDNQLKINGNISVKLHNYTTIKNFLKAVKISMEDIV